MPLIEVHGKPGAGKSSFVVAIIIDNFMKSFNWRYKAACKEIKNEAKIKGMALSIPPQRHVVFSSGLKIKRKLPSMESYDFEPYKLSMPNEQFETLKIMSHGVYIIDEAQGQLDSKGVNKELPLPTTRLYETRRHKDLLIFLISQREKRINNDIRSIADVYVYIETSVHTTKVGNKAVKYEGRFPSSTITKTEFKGRWFADEKDFETYTESGEEAGHKLKYVFHGDIRDYYNPYEFSREYEGTDKTLEDKDYEYFPKLSGKKPPGYINYNQEVKKGKKEVKNGKERNANSKQST